MPRNLDRRVEVIAPIDDRSLHPRVCSLLETSLADNRTAWDLQSDGSYVQRKPGTHPTISIHERFLINSWGLEFLGAARENGETTAEYAVRSQSAVPTSSS